MISDVPSFPDGDNQKTVIEHLLGDSNCSVYSRLKAHLASPYPSLAPQKTVNSIFTSLVDLLQRGPHSAASTIANSPLLLARAKTIAEAANRAEHLLEYHYASVILNSNQVGCSRRFRSHAANWSSHGCASRCTRHIGGQQ